MAKFLIGLLAGIVLTVLGVSILLFAAVRMRERPPAVASGSTLVLELNGGIPERAPVELPVFFGRESRPTVADLWMRLRMAAEDSRIKAVVIEPTSLDVGWGKLEELRSGLVRFRKSGKPLWAYLKSPGAREYYLASAAERIYLGPADIVMLKGMRAETMYFKGTLDKLGVDVQVEHAGKYKDFGDMFTRTGMSPETREVLDSLLDVLYGNLVNGIAEGRHKSAAEVRALIDQGPFLAAQALKGGLVDELRFEDQMYGELKDRLRDGEIKKLSLGRYLRVQPESVGLYGRERIALVVAQGDITRGDPQDTGMGDEGITSEGFTRLLRRVEGDGGIRGVIVRIDSPGGDAIASDEIWREMNLLSKKKPMVISMSDAAASGGYYMAMTGDPVVSYPGTYTGSIGVVFGKPTLRGLYNKLGITKDTLTRGRYAAIDSDYTTLGPAELEKVRQGVDASYEDFVAKVASARHRTVEQIHALAQGRVWLGAQAKQNGLVDEIGGLDRALDLVKQKAGIPAGRNVTLVPFPARRSLLDLVLERGGPESVEAGILRKIHAPLWYRGGILRLMPYSIEVR